MTDPGTRTEAAFWITLGRRVKAARTAAGLTQDDYADRIGMARSSIANLEAGRHRVPVYELLRLRSIAPFQIPGLPADEEAASVAALTERVSELSRTNRQLRARIRRARVALGPDGPDERERDG